DIDHGDTFTVTGVKEGTHTSATGNVATSVVGTYGSVVIDANGTYTYTLDNSKAEVQALAKDQEVTDTFTYTITDSHGATATTTLTVTVVGTNDDPKIYLTGSDSASASLTESDTTLTTTGTLSLADVDVIDVVNATKVDSIAKGGTYTGTLPTDAELKAMFTVSGNLDATETDKTSGITWTFNSGSHYFDGMAAGETLILTYTVQVTDPHGATDTHDVVITITGTNDAPTIIAGGVLTGSATELVDKHADENTHDHTASGYFDVTDADLTDAVSVSATPQGVGYLGTFTPVVDTQTTSGATGKITWEFKVNDAALDHLAEGETVTQLYDVTVDDGKGGTDTITVTVTITGSNDAPEIHVRAGDSDAESLTESNIALTATGTLSLSDVDVIDVVNATE
ncbi:VCBS domain-containing protein, partial [Synergistaceae bacterium DZ-S4]